MIVKRKSDGKVIEVREWRGASDVVYSDPDMNRFYQNSDLDFNVKKSTYESDLHISVAKLREVLTDMADGSGLLIEDVNDIINRVKESI